MGSCPISDARSTDDADHAAKTRELRINALGQTEYQQDRKVEKIDGDDD